MNRSGLKNGQILPWQWQLDKEGKMVKSHLSLFITVIILLFPAALFGRGADEKESVVQERINAYFFFEELCGSCNDDVEKFTSILSDKLPLSERQQYPNNFNIHNIYESYGQQEYVKVTDGLGIDRSSLSLPLFIVGGRVFQGYDSITANIREAYLTAAEDLYVYKRPYNPRTRKTGVHLFDDYTVNPENVTVVYFYRITCPECAQVTPIIDALPRTIQVNGKERLLDIIRINTRSGNNGERVIAFFEAWQVPDADRMVPIVFFSDSYLAGFDAISAGLKQELNKTPVPWKLLNERK